MALSSVMKGEGVKLAFELAVLDEILKTTGEGGIDGRAGVGEEIREDIAVEVRMEGIAIFGGANVGVKVAVELGVSGAGGITFVFVRILLLTTGVFRSVLESVSVSVERGMGP